MIINNINIFQSIKKIAIQKFNKYIAPVKFNLPKLRQLTKDFFELKERYPEILSYCPETQIKKIDYVKDSRFAMFSLDYRAYDFESKGNEFPNHYICIDSNGDRRFKPRLFLKYVEIKPEFAKRGIYKKTINLLTSLSELEGCEGRITLVAHKIECPEGTQIPSPSLAHWKCGFRFTNEKNNEIMQKVLSGELPLEEAPEGSMYYAHV